MENNIETKYKKLIIAVSIIIPIAVAALFGVNLRKIFIPQKNYELIFLQLLIW